MARWATPSRIDGNAAALYARARKLGMHVEVIHRPVDALVYAHGFLLAVETKQPKGKLRPGQIAFLARCQGAVSVWRTVEDVEASYQHLRLQAIRLAVP